MWQRLDRVPQHLTASGENIADHGRRNPSSGYIQRRLDHREREALDAEAIELEVATLRLKQALRQLTWLRMISEQGREPLLRHPIELLVLPEGVVGVEA